MFGKYDGLMNRPHHSVAVHHAAATRHRLPPMANRRSTSNALLITLDEQYGRLVEPLGLDAEDKLLDVADRLADRITNLESPTDEQIIYEFNATLDSTLEALLEPTAADARATDERLIADLANEPSWIDNDDPVLLKRRLVTILVLVFAVAAGGAASGLATGSPVIGGLAALSLYLFELLRRLEGR
jgi:hypothetical protein